MASPNFLKEVLFSNVSPSPDANIYTATFSGTNINEILVGMWVTNSPYGHAFQIQLITPISSEIANVTLEDVNGYNTENDPSGIGGGPANDTNGYIFTLSPASIASLVTVTSSAGLDWGSSISQRFSTITSSSLPQGIILRPPICLEIL